MSEEDAPFWLRYYSAKVLDEFVMLERTLLPISLTTKVSEIFAP